MVVTSEQAYNLRVQGLAYSQIAKKLSLSNKGIAYRLVQMYAKNPTYTEKVGNKVKYSNRKWGINAKEKFNDEWINAIYNILPKYIAKNAEYSINSIEGQEIYDRIIDYAYTTKFKRGLKGFWISAKIMVKHPHHKNNKKFNEGVNYEKM